MLSSWGKMRFNSLAYSFSSHLSLSPFLFSVSSLFVYKIGGLSGALGFQQEYLSMSGSDWYHLGNIYIKICIDCPTINLFIKLGWNLQVIYSHLLYIIQKRFKEKDDQREGKNSQSFRERKLLSIYSNREIESFHSIRNHVSVGIYERELSWKPWERRD